MPRSSTVPTEQQEAFALAAFLRAQESAGRLVFLHVPNEGRRTGREGALAKKAGLRPGAPDYLVFLRGGTVLALELKRRDAPPGEPWGVRVGNAYLRPNQAEWLERLSAMGVVCRACAGAKEAVQWLRAELGLAGAGVHNADMENESTEPQAAAKPEIAPTDILEILADGKPRTGMELAKALGVKSAKELRNDLSWLRRSGQVTTTGQRRGTRYSLASKSEAAE